MAEVRLDKEWTDPAGVTHAAGDTVDVDEKTLADLRDAGIVGDVTDAGWAGPTFAGDDTGGADDGRTPRPRTSTTPTSARYSVDRTVAISIDDVGNLADTITKATLAAAAVVAVLVILIGLVRAVRDRLRQQLVISDTTPLPAAVAGSEGEANTLSPWLRQRVQTALSEQMEEARGIVERVFSVDVALHRLPAEIALDQGTESITSAARDTLATVANGLRAVAPGQADGILGALASALPKPRGANVQTAPLLRGPVDTFRLGLSIELNNLEGSPLAATTLWEPLGYESTAPTQSGQERLVLLIEPASHWVALRLASQRLRATPARALRRPSFRRRGADPNLDLQRLLAAALTLNAMRAFGDHTLAFGGEALDDLRQIGDALGRYHRPYAIAGAVHEAMGFAYLKEHDLEKARRSFLAARDAWAKAEELLGEHGRGRSAISEAELADERERHRVRRIKCALLSGDAAAMAPATDELRDEPALGIRRPTHALQHRLPLQLRGRAGGDRVPAAGVGVPRPLRAGDHRLGRVGPGPRRSRAGAALRAGALPRRPQPHLVDAPGAQPAPARRLARRGRGVRRARPAVHIGSGAAPVAGRHAVALRRRLTSPNSCHR